MSKISDNTLEQIALRIDYPRITTQAAGVTKVLSHSQGQSLIQGISEYLSPALRACLEYAWEDDVTWELIRENKALDERSLPFNPSDAMDKLGVWLKIEADLPHSYHYRYRKIIQAQAMGLLRSLAAQDKILQGITQHINEEHEAAIIRSSHANDDANMVISSLLSTAQGLSLAYLVELFTWEPFTWVRNLHRSVLGFIQEHDSLPTGIRDIIDLPVPGVRIAYQYTDNQLQRNKRITPIVKSDTSGSGLVAYEYSIELKHPKGYWFTITKTLPDNTPDLDASELLSRITAPVLWVDDAGKLRARLNLNPSASSSSQARKSSNPGNLMHADWNVTGALLSMTTSSSKGTGTRKEVIINQARFEYDPFDLMRKVGELIKHNHYLQKKTKHYKKLLSNQTNLDKYAYLNMKLLVLQRERDYVNKSRKDLSKRVADDCARETLYLMQELGIKNLVMEDLKSLEAKRGHMSKSINQLINQSPRGLIIQRLRTVLQRDGRSLVLVNSKHTSQACPYCGSKISHPEHRLSYCSECERSGERDDWASQRIGLKHLKQNKITRRRATLLKAEKELVKNWLSQKHVSVRDSISPVRWVIVSTGDQGVVERQTGIHTKKSNQMKKKNQLGKHRTSLLLHKKTQLT